MLESADDALETIAAAVKKAGYKLGKDIFIALDAAASEFYDRTAKIHVSRSPTGRKKTVDEMIAYYWELAKKYPIISIEDGCAENDWAGWKKLTDAHGQRDPARRRRPLRHQHELPAAGHRTRASPTPSS